MLRTLGERWTGSSGNLDGSPLQLCEQLIGLLRARANIEAIADRWARHVPRQQGSECDMTRACAEVMLTICSPIQLELHDSYLQLFDRAPSMRIRLDDLSLATVRWLRKNLQDCLFSNMKMGGSPHSQRTLRYGFAHNDELEKAYNAHSNEITSAKNAFLLAYVLVHVRDAEQLGYREPLKIVETALQHVWMEQELKVRELLTDKRGNLKNGFELKKRLQDRLTTARRERELIRAEEEEEEDEEEEEEESEIRIGDDDDEEEEEEDVGYMHVTRGEKERDESRRRQRIATSGLQTLTFGRMALQNTSVMPRSRLENLTAANAHLIKHLEVNIGRLEATMLEFEESLAAGTYIMNLRDAVKHNRLNGSIEKFMTLG